MSPRTTPFMSPRAKRGVSLGTPPRTPFCHPERSEGCLSIARQDRVEDVAPNVPFMSPRATPFMSPRATPFMSPRARARGLPRDAAPNPILSPRTKRGMPRYRSAGQGRGCRPERPFLLPRAPLLCRPIHPFYIASNSPFHVAPNEVRGPLLSIS
jgi:hypothetical protein